jgi:hypothetical protein
MRFFDFCQVPGYLESKMDNRRARQDEDGIAPRHGR